MLIPNVIETDLAIIGAGMAGMCAAVFAANRRMNAVMVGGAGAFEYASGLLDLWGSSLKQPYRYCKNPWQQLAQLERAWPDHPYLKIEQNQIEQAFSELTLSLERQGLSYYGTPARNQMVLAPLGTWKPTFRIPLGMKGQAGAFEQKAPCLILDFKGLREFSATFVKAMQPSWPDLRNAQIVFPGTRNRSEVHLPLMAQLLESEHHQEALIRQVRPLLNGAAYLGLPAVLGFDRVQQIKTRLESELSVTLFEIPTTPVSVPGIRLKQAFYRALQGSSVKVLQNQRIHRAKCDVSSGFELEIETDMNRGVLHAKSVILATGRFLGGGLAAGLNGIHETVFNLPVCQPATRNNWHSKDFFDPNGHPVNQAGIRTDHMFRPMDQNKTVIHPHLFAAGTILADQDWIRTGSGSGISIATAFAAVHYCRQR